MQGNKLADDSLMIGIFLTMFPLFIILTAWSAVGIKFNTRLFPNNVSPRITMLLLYYL